MEDVVSDARTRTRASLLGLSNGDAFGEALATSADPDRRASKRLLPAKPPWRWTDDTAMATARRSAESRSDGSATAAAV